MRRKRKVKILATLGPTSNTAEAISELFLAGADIFRINMSHATHDEMRRLVKLIRQVESDHRRPIGILVDLQGPKLRIGEFANESIEIEAGQKFILDSDPAPGDEHRVQLPHRDVMESLLPGHMILLDDGRVRLKVLTHEGDHVVTEVISGKKLSNRKGVSLPNTTLHTSALTPKDRRDLEAALGETIDWVAMSFIQRPDDIAEVRKLARGRAGVLAKIEKPQAVEQLDEIIELADAIMVARGDLGVEIPVEKVPGIQKRITRAGRAAGKPVVVATQMLESMITAAAPTRAEVSDVATAVFEGADAVMLSAESASGEYPVEAVKMMNSIAEAVEREQYYPNIINAQRPEPLATGADAITAAARQIAETLSLGAIVCFTSSGSTGLRASRERPFVPIVALSPVRSTARRLSLVWGLHCVVSEDVMNIDEMVDRACRIAHEEGFAVPGERIIITAGVPFGTPGSTNLLRLAFVSPDGMTGV
ncbi:pyruvate kinase [Afifella sp. IM 167]|uniref:pyruvate kinase n=1 Tax=Afifella sp. IM 167 TaxID=2033586 RepID=UPI001CC94136|nr:pyruvate kinase [Afifella sp. IM 167]MBZ8135341.1 pyruvate kinase [Afifella sp. IM 167]